ncbi:unnamed protein product, partial [Allacma fusca]
MDSPVHMLWFVCKFCKRAFACQDKLIEHKNDAHADEIRREKRKSRRSKTHRREHKIKTELDVKIPDDDKSRCQDSGVEQVTGEEPNVPLQEVDNEIQVQSVSLEEGPASPVSLEVDIIDSSQLDCETVPEVSTVTAGSKHGFEDYDDSRVCVLLTCLTPGEVETLRKPAPPPEPIVVEESQGNCIKNKPPKRVGRGRSVRKDRRKIKRLKSLKCEAPRIQPRRSSVQPIYTHRFLIQSVQNDEDLKPSLRAGLRTNRASKFSNLNFDILPGDSMCTKSLKEVLSDETHVVAADAREKLIPTVDVFAHQAEDSPEVESNIGGSSEVVSLPEANGPQPTVSPKEPFRGNDTPVNPGQSGKDVAQQPLSSSSFSCTKCFQKFSSYDTKQGHEVQCLLFHCKFCKVLCLDRPSLVFHEVLKHSVELEKINNLKLLGSQNNSKSNHVANISNTSQVDTVNVACISEDHDREGIAARVTETSLSEIDISMDEVVEGEQPQLEVCVSNREGSPSGKHGLHSNIEHNEPINNIKQIQAIGSIENAQTFNGDIPQHLSSVNSHQQNDSQDMIDMEHTTIDPDIVYISTEIPKEAKTSENTDNLLDISNYDDDLDEGFPQIIKIVSFATIMEPELSTEEDAGDIQVCSDSQPACFPVNSIELSKTTLAAAAINMPPVSILSAENEEDLDECMCEHCGKCFRNFKTLKRHCGIRHPILGPFECHNCKNFFQHRISLTKHGSNCSDSEKKIKNRMERIKAALKFKRKTILCKYRDYLILSSLEIKKVQNDRKRKRKMYKCKRCSKLFRKGNRTNKLLFAQHMSSVHRVSGTSYLCSDCGKSFGTPWSFRRHIIIHYPYNFNCGTCSKKFLNRWQLHQHTKRNLLEVATKCESCVTLCISKCQIKTHEQEHLASPVVASESNIATAVQTTEEAIENLCSTQNVRRSTRQAKKSAKAKEYQQLEKEIAEFKASDDQTLVERSVIIEERQEEWNDSVVRVTRSTQRNKYIKKNDDQAVEKPNKSKRYKTRSSSMMPSKEQPKVTPSCGPMTILIPSETILSTSKGEETPISEFGSPKILARFAASISDTRNPTNLDEETAEMPEFQMLMELDQETTSVSECATQKILEVEAPGTSRSETPKKLDREVADISDFQLLESEKDIDDVLECETLKNSEGEAAKIPDVESPTKVDVEVASLSECETQKILDGESTGTSRSEIPKKLDGEVAEISDFQILELEKEIDDVLECKTLKNSEGESAKIPDGESPKKLAGQVANLSDCDTQKSLDGESTGTFGSEGAKKSDGEVTDISDCQSPTKLLRNKSAALLIKETSSSPKRILRKSPRKPTAIGSIDIWARIPSEPVLKNSSRSAMNSSESPAKNCSKIQTSGNSTKTQKEENSKQIPPNCPGNILVKFSTNNPSEIVTKKSTGSSLKNSSVSPAKKCSKNPETDNCPKCPAKQSARLRAISNCAKTVNKSPVKNNVKIQVASDSSKSPVKSPAKKNKSENSGRRSRKDVMNVLRTPTRSNSSEIETKKSMRSSSKNPSKIPAKRSSENPEAVNGPKSPAKKSSRVRAINNAPKILTKSPAKNSAKIQVTNASSVSPVKNPVKVLKRENSGRASQNDAAKILRTPASSTSEFETERSTRSSSKTLSLSPTKMSSKNPHRDISPKKLSRSPKKKPELDESIQGSNHNIATRTTVIESAVTKRKLRYGRALFERLKDSSNSHGIG